MRSIDAVLALLARDLRGFLRSRSQLYSSILFPLMLLAIIGTGVRYGLEPRKVDDYLTFMTPGIIVMTAVFSSTFSNASYYADRDSGILRVLLAAPHPSGVVLLAKTLSGVAVGAAQALLVLGIAAAIPAIDFQWQYGVLRSLALTLAAILLLTFFLACLGQWLASHIRSMQGFHLVMNLVLLPLLFFSPAFFPVEDVPAWLNALVRINPLSYAVDAMQLALYADGSDGHFGLALDFAVTAALAAGIFYAAVRRGISPER